jgi:23S rRNA (pseudouridine1915-N3)-methyltransferase
MKTIHIISLGKLKETYWQEAEAEYRKRLSSTVKIVWHELKEESFTEKDAVEAIKAKEAKKILSELEKIKDSFVVALEEKGKQFSSVQFALTMNNETMNQFNNIVYIIGGPLGLDRSVVSKAQTTLSLSPLTFTHQMTRVILLEQIYRAFMINSGRKYHY